MGKIVLGYWAIRGLAEPSRMMLEYGGLDWENKYYECGEAPDYDRSQWLDVKFTLGFDFPNLPYLIDGDIKMTESWAILKHLGRKVGVAPKTAKAQYECDMLEGVITSLRNGFTGVCYRPNFEENKTGMRESQSGKLAQFEAFLEGRKYLAGDHITPVDFAFFETLDHHRLLFPNILDKFANVKAFMQRFESLDRISAYFKSNRYHRFPINNKMARWGGGKE